MLTCPNWHVFGCRDGASLQTLCSLQKHPPVYLIARGLHNDQWQKGNRWHMERWGHCIHHEGILKSSPFQWTLSCCQGFLLNLTLKRFKEARRYDPKGFQDLLQGSLQAVQQPQGWLQTGDWRKGDAQETAFAIVMTVEIVTTSQLLMATGANIIMPSLVTTLGLVLAQSLALVVQYIPLVIIDRTFMIMTRGIGNKTVVSSTILEWSRSIKHPHLKPNPLWSKWLSHL